MAEETKPKKNNHTARLIFGVFMIAIYVGMGILMMMNYFQWSGEWEWLRWLFGVLFIVYGLWRAYRQFRGIDYYVGDNLGK